MLVEDVAEVVEAVELDHEDVTFVGETISSGIAHIDARGWHNRLQLSPRLYRMEL